MPLAPSLRRFSAPAWVRADALNVTPELLGMALAPPVRRVLAISVDGVAILLLSSTGAFWIAAGIAALVFQLRHRQPERSWRRHALLWLALALLVFLGAQQVTRFVEREARLPATSLGAALADDDDDDAIAPAALPASSAAARIATLEAALAESRKPLATRWRDDALRRMHKLGLGFGWAIAYFTLLPFWWRGQTLGKRLFGLRIVELTGKPLKLMTCFGRYGGYAAGMATGGAGFAQVLWDANRQAIQDKIAHTVVVDLRAPRRPALPDEATPIAATPEPAPVDPTRERA